MKLYAEHLQTFPWPDETGPEGILQISDDISAERLLEAYSFGIFPWPTVGHPILWFSPPERGVIDFDRFHEPRSLKKWRRHKTVRFTWDKNFAAVIENCQRANRPGQSGTWITPRLKKAYLEFHEAGYAHSLECWREDTLIGGLYGVHVAGAFCGESMFFREPNASKACLVRVVEFLREQGLQWMDTQMLTPTVESFGGYLISRDEFQQRLASAKKKSVRLNFS